MIIYAVIMIIAILFYFINEKLTDRKEKQFFEILMVIILALLAGLRFEVGGTDYIVYKKVYNIIPKIGELNLLNSSLETLTFGMEKGFLIYVSLFKTIGLTYNGFLLFNSIIFYLAMYFILRNRIKNFNFFLIFFMYKMMFYNTFTSLRQPIAMLIFWYSIKFVEERKLLKYVLCCILCMLFHSSAIILIFIYFLYDIKMNKKTFLTISGICVIFLLLNIFNIYSFNPLTLLLKIFNDQSNVEKLEGYFYDTTNILSVLNIVELYIIIYIYIKTKNVSEEKLKMEGALLICLMIIFTIFPRYVIVARLRDYFVVYYTIILEKYINTNGRYTKIIRLGFIAFCIIGYFRYIFVFDSGELLNYTTFIQNGISIFE